MDHASFALRQHLLVLHQAGIRVLLPGPDSALDAVSNATTNAAPDAAISSVLHQSPWAGFLGKVPQGAASIWTYEGLGQDLTGQPSAERRQILGKLLGLMRLPKGYVGFFPYCLPQGTGQQLGLDAFLEAMTSLDPVSVVLFADGQGHPLVQAMASQADSFLLLQFPSLDSLLRLNDHELAATAAHVKNSIFPAA